MNFVFLCFIIFGAYTITKDKKWTKEKVEKEVFNNKVCGRDKDCE